MDIAQALRARNDRRANRIGLVSAYTAGASVISVTVDGAVVTLPCVRGTYNVNDSVLINRDGLSGGWVIGAVGAATVTVPAEPAAPPPPPAEPAKKRRTKLVLPAFTGSFRGGAWRDVDQVWQGDYGGWGINQGAAYYGSGLKGLHADTSLPCSALLHFRRRLGGVYAGQAPTFYLLSGLGRPAGAPARNESAAGPAIPVNTVGSWQLPTSWAIALLNGSRGGIGIYVPGSDPYVGLDGPSTYSQSMALSLVYYA